MDQMMPKKTKVFFFLLFFKTHLCTVLPLGTWGPKDAWVGIPLSKPGLCASEHFLQDSLLQPLPYQFPRGSPMPDDRAHSWVRPAACPPPHPSPGPWLSGEKFP